MIKGKKNNNKNKLYLAFQSWNLLQHFFISKMQGYKNKNNNELK